MGAHRYCYFTAWQADIDAALQALREAEFRAGRYDPAMRAADPPRYMFELDFPADARSPAPGPVHASLEALLDDATEDGTGSILDLMWISEEPHMLAASPLTDDELRALFGTTTPSRVEVEDALIRAHDPAVMKAAADVYNRVGRGEGRYVVLYDAGQPREIFFFGYSID
jgi:hypothetical protein